MQDLFAQGEWLERENLRVYWHPQFLEPSLGDTYLARLQKSISWQQGQIQLYNQQVAEPRLSAYYGETEAHYEYSGRQVRPAPWSPVLLELKQALSQATNANFNAVLCNYYRDHNDGMSWHSDDEPELGQHPEIASLSFGGARRFVLRKKSDHAEKISFDLGHGDLLIMAGKTQQYWQHQVPKTRQTQPARINLTFRKIISR